MTTEELRFEILKHSHHFLDSSFHSNCKVIDNFHTLKTYSHTNSHDHNSIDTISELQLNHYPDYPSYESVEELAERMFNFVNMKQN